MQDAFGALTDRLNGVWAALKDEATLSAANVKAPLKDIRRALLEADVSLPVVRRFIKSVEEKAVGVKVTKGVNASQQLTKVVADELCELMGGFGGDKLVFKDEGQGPTVILMAGLQGVGKTTACGKLALFLKKQGKTSLLVATDVYRPAAIEQLKKLGEQIGVPVFDMGVTGDPPEIARLGLQKAVDEKIDVVIVDTAGRLTIDAQLMNELLATKAATNADETLLVVDAMTGQEAATLTAAFNDAVGITGAVLTKMDGDTRGGAALSVREVSGKPIKFTGIGEKMDALEPFYPERMTSRILGMGDVVTLVERAQDAVKEEQATQMRDKIMSATFDFNDFLTQMEMMQNMGGMGGLGGLIYSFSMGDLNSFNASHTIHHLSFGPKIPGVKNPLDGVHNEVQQGTGQYMYYIKVVPTDYVALGGAVTRSNQFSVTEHFVMVDFMAGQFPHPGVFLKYDFSPIMVEYRESRKGLAHLVTNVCAIVGGVFTTFSMISGIVHRAEQALKKED